MLLPASPEEGVVSVVGFELHPTFWGGNYLDLVLGLSFAVYSKSVSRGYIRSFGKE